MIKYDDFIKKLEENYSISSTNITVEALNSKIYTFPLDYRFNKLIDCFYQFNKSKINQIKFIFDFYNFIKKSKFNNIEKNKEFRVFIDNKKIIIKVEEFIHFSIYLDNNINKNIFTLFDVKVDLNDSDFYEKVYQHYLSEINNFKIKDFKSLEFYFNNSIDDIIQNIAFKNDFIYYTEENFEKKFIIDNNKIFYKKSLTTKIPDQIKPFLSNFLKGEKLNKLSEIISLFVFYSKILNKPFDLNFSRLSNLDRSALSLDLYSIILNFNKNTAASSFLLLSTTEDFITYHETFDNFNIISGYENIFSFFKTEILNNISKNLNIEVSNINNKSLNLFNILNY
jgi:hypothetical protein